MGYITMADDVSVPFLGLRPIRDYFYVRQEEPREKIGSLYVPQGSEKWPPIGTVVACGPGVHAPDGTWIPMLVKVGDRILFKRRAASALLPDHREVDDRNLYGIVRLQECDIVGILDPDCVVEEQKNREGGP